MAGVPDPEKTGRDRVLIRRGCRKCDSPFYKRMDLDFTVSAALSSFSETPLPSQCPYPEAL